MVSRNSFWSPFINWIRNICMSCVWALRMQKCGVCACIYVCMCVDGGKQIGLSDSPHGFGHCCCNARQTTPLHTQDVLHSDHMSSVESHVKCGVTLTHMA